MKNKALLALVVMLSSFTFGQIKSTTTAFPNAPAPDPFETGWTLAVSGNYANISNAASNNGLQTIEELRIAQHWAARSDQFMVLSPEVVIVTAGPEYIFSLQHLLSKTNFAVNSSKFEAFADLGAGTARSVIGGGSQPQLSKADLAWKIGGGFRYLASTNVTVTPLDVSYVRAPLLQGGGQVLGNQVDFATGLGIRF